MDGAERECRSASVTVRWGRVGDLVHCGSLGQGEEGFRGRLKEEGTISEGRVLPHTWEFERPVRRICLRYHSLHFAYGHGYLLALWMPCHSDR